MLRVSSRYNAADEQILKHEVQPLGARIGREGNRNTVSTPAALVVDPRGPDDLIVRQLPGPAHQVLDARLAKIDPSDDLPRLAAFRRQPSKREFLLAVACRLQKMKLYPAHR